MLRVLHIVLNLNVGGLERFIVELIKNFSGDVVTYILCLEEEGVLAGQVNGTVIALNEKPGLKLKSINKITEIIRQNKIHLVHTHNEAAHFYGAIAGVFCKLPVIHTRHGRYQHSSNKKMLLNTLASLLSTRIVGVSDDISHLITKAEFIKKEKVLTILNGVDIGEYLPRVSGMIPADIFGATAGCVRIGIVARLDMVKDHANLLDACDLLHKQAVDFRLIVVGDGPLRCQLEHRVKELQLDQKVGFTGTRHDIAAVLNMLDIFVLSSKSEGISMTLLESMSCCLPVVATEVGGNPEVVVDGETGYLVPPENPGALADKLLQLILDPALRKSMGVAGREQIMSKFSISQTASAYEQLYQGVLALN